MLPLNDAALTFAPSAIFCLLWLRARYRQVVLERRIAALENAELKKDAGVLEREFRLERFEVLWYPVVSFSPPTKTVAKVAPGLPHCRACVRALTLALDGAWACPQCRAAYPRSLADIAVTDSIAKEALRYFLERNKDYAVTAGASRA